MTKLIFAALAGLLISSAIHAKELDKKPVAAAIKTLEDRGVITVIKSFPTQEPGLTGYVVKSQDGRTALLFGMGDYAFSGTLIDSKGQNATKLFADAELPKPDWRAAAMKLKKDPYLVSEGNKDAPEVFVFADPNCIFCHKFWRQTRAWVKDGKLKLQWVMVGFLKPSSPGRAAAIMASKDGAKALEQDEKTFNTDQEEGAIKPLKHIPAALKTALDQHAKMMSELGFGGTPSLIFRDKQGHWHGLSGLPQGDTLPKALGFKP